MLEAADFKANSQGRFKVKFRNVGLKFPTVGALKGYFSRFGAVEDVHLEDEMPVEDETLDDGTVRIKKKKISHSQLTNSVPTVTGRSRFFTV